MSSIQFGQGRGYPIFDDAIINHINFTVVQKARINLQNGNKSYKPFELSDIETLKLMPHKITFNLKGRPTIGYLYLFKFQGRPFCVYIKEKEGHNKERVFDYIMVKHRFNESLYHGTLFQGNFLQLNQYQNIFLIHDLLMWKDQAYLQSLSERIEILNDIFKFKFNSDPGLDTHQIILKEYASYNQMDDFLNNYRNTLPYRDFINGLIFRPEERSQKLIYLILNRPDVVKGFNSDENNNVEQQLIPKKALSPILEDKVQKVPKFRIDSAKHSRVNFRMKKTPKQDVYELYLEDLPQKYGIASVTSINHSKEIREWFVGADTDEVIIEAEYMHTFNKWKPVKLLVDSNVSSCLNLV